MLEIVSFQIINFEDKNGMHFVLRHVPVSTQVTNSCQNPFILNFMDNLEAFSIGALRQFLFFPMIQNNVSVTTFSTHFLETPWLLKIYQ